METLKRANAKRKRGVSHYRLDAGTACEVRPTGAAKWVPHTTTRTLWFVERGGDETHAVFEFDGWEIRVAVGLVKGSAAERAGAA